MEKYYFIIAILYLIFQWYQKSRKKGKKTEKKPDTGQNPYDINPPIKGEEDEQPSRMEKILKDLERIAEPEKMFFEKEKTEPIMEVEPEEAVNDKEETAFLNVEESLEYIPESDENQQPELPTENEELLPAKETRVEEEEIVKEEKEEEEEIFFDVRQAIIYDAILNKPYP